MQKGKREDLLDSEASRVKPKIGDRFVNEFSGDDEECERQREINDEDVEILSAKESSDFVAVSRRKWSPERGVSDEKTEDIVGDSKSPVAKGEVEDKSVANASNQLVVYERSLNDANQVSVFTESPTRLPSTRNTTNRVSPSIGTFTAQCADCFKWGYYTTPTGKTLRSLVEVQKFLLNHPEFMQAGVNLSQFSFQIPKPLNDAHVRKRSYRSASRTPVDANFGFSESVGSGIVEPLAWVDPHHLVLKRMGA